MLGSLMADLNIKSHSCTSRSTPRVDASALAKNHANP